MNIIDEMKKLDSPIDWNKPDYTGASADYYLKKYVNRPEDKDKWMDVTRRETLEGAEAAIEGSVDHFSKKIEYIKGPKVVKTFK